MRIEVIYALPLAQERSCIELPAGATVRAAIEQCGLLARYPEIDLRNSRVGVWGRRTALDATLRDGDRVEIYRALRADPKQARRARVARKRASR